MKLMERELEQNMTGTDKNKPPLSLQNNETSYIYT